MACEVNQDVDAVGTNGVGQLGVGQLGDVAPLVKRGLQSLGYSVLHRVVVVGIQRHGGRLGKLLQYRLNESRNGMAVKVARDEPDFQCAQGIFGVGMR